MTDNSNDEQYDGGQSPHERAPDASLDDATGSVDMIRGIEKLRDIAEEVLGETGPLYRVGLPGGVLEGMGVKELQVAEFDSIEAGAVCDELYVMFIGQQNNDLSYIMKRYKNGYVEWFRDTDDDISNQIDDARTAQNIIQAYHDGTFEEVARQIDEQQAFDKIVDPESATREVRLSNDTPESQQLITLLRAAAQDAVVLRDR